MVATAKDNYSKELEAVGSYSGDMLSSLFCALNVAICYKLLL